MGKILLYYKYITIEDPELIMNWQHELCERLNLKGRIIIATEGINGTVGGSQEATEEYVAEMSRHPLFHDIIFKQSEGSSEHFPRLRVVVKEEIVRLGISPQAVPATERAQHLTPQEVHEKLNALPQDLVILDARNNYESRIGTFVGAITPDISTFREFPEYIDKNAELFKDKEVLMFCTGGVRCERASAYLKSKGITKAVYQLEGGIHCYLEEYPDGHFRGKNFVFDARVSMATNEDVLAHCINCKISCDNYTHCVINLCNKLMIMCSDCIGKLKNTCGQECLHDLTSGNPIRYAPYKKTVSCEL